MAVMTAPSTTFERRNIAAPWGHVYAVATDDGIASLHFDGATLGVDQTEGVATPLTSLHLDVLERELAEYFAGERTSFDVPLDLSRVKGFRADVLVAMQRIEYGTTASYTELAAAAGRPAAVRAAASGCATNPVAIIVPCHRVLRSDGTLGGYAGGLDVKQLLLALEQR